MALQSTGSRKGEMEAEAGAFQEMMRGFWVDGKSFGEIKNALGGARAGAAIRNAALLK